MKFKDILPVLNEEITTQLTIPANTLAAAMGDPTKAPGRFPYPLDTVMDQFVDSYLKLHNICEMLDMATHNPSLGKDQRKKLALYRDKMVMAMKTVHKVAKHVDKDFSVNQYE